MSLYHIIRSNLMIDNPSKVLLPQNSPQQWMLLAIHSQWVMRVAIRDFQISFQIYMNAILAALLLSMKGTYTVGPQEGEYLGTTHHRKYTFRTV